MTAEQIAPPRSRRIDARPSSRAERSRLTQELLEQAHGQSDERRRADLLEEVVLLNRGVAEAIAGRYRGRGVPREDLEQAAYEGLVKAVQRFDPTVRPDLLTYAVPTIRGEVQRWFRDHSWMVRPPRRIQELQWQISRSRDQLAQELGREPTHLEITDDLGCSADDVRDAIQGFGAFQPPSLDQPVAGVDGATIGSTLTAGDDGQEAAEARATLAPVVRTLSPRDRRIIYLRYFEDRSQTDIGAELGVTQMQVSRLLDRILRSLRTQLV
jgi:RNA polymerase sigma-B factor